MKRLLAALLVAGLGVSAFALELNLGLAPTGDGGRGFGYLAEYPAGGPQALTITRKTLPGKPKPDYFKKWGTICNLRVYDPDGFEAAYLEMGEQTAAEQTYTVKVPKGKAGIWCVSVSGGFCPAGRYEGDTFRLVVPDSPVWGVRGEKGLRILPGGAPAKLHLAFAPTSDLFYLAGDNVTWTIGGKGVSGETGSSSVGKKAVLGHRPKDAKTVAISIEDPKTAARFYVDGLPNTLSPTPEMALKLMGGAVQAANGDWCEGPLQAACRNVMLKLAGKDMDISAFHGKLLSDNSDWTWSVFTNQVLDVHSSNYGQTFVPQRAPNNADFFHYLGNFYVPGLLAQNAALSKAFVRRALLAGFSTLSGMDACGINCATKSDTRPLNGVRIDFGTGFDGCVGIARGYANLKAFLPPEIERLYREGVLQILMKQQGFMSYQSNQWMHILEAYNEFFCATGDKRIERCLRLQLESFIRNDFNAKHGQHPAGFYSEECGPDGNYDQMSCRPMSVIYHTYAKMPGADANLVHLMKRSLEENFRFRAMFAVPDPATTNGAPYQLAYAMNHRTDGPTHFDSHGGVQANTNEFPMAYTLLALGQSWRDESRCLKLPYELQSVSTWNPGFLSMRRGNFYGVQFWKVYDYQPDGFLGPLFLWHAKAGMGLCGVKHSYGKRHSHWFGSEMDENDVTFATVYGYVDGKLYVPSRKMKKELVWNAWGKSYTVTGTDEKLKGKIVWTTDFVSDDAVAFTIDVDFPALKDATVNLPLLKQKGRTVWSSEGWRKWKLEGNKLVQEAPNGTFTITFPEGLEATATDEIYGNRGWVMALRLKVPASGKVTALIEAKLR